MRKSSKKQRLVSELAAIQRLQEERPLWFKQHDYDRLRNAWAAKSAELVSLEVSTHRKRIKW